MKKFILLCLIVSLSFLVFACKNDESSYSTIKKAIPANEIKIGFVYFYPPNKSSYIFLHEKARLKVEKNLQVETMVGEYAIGEAETLASIDGLIEQGCNVIYATSDAHSDGVILAAKKYPHIIFGHSNGLVQLENLTIFRPKTYEARYLSGLIAGMATKSNKIGYIASMPIPEVVRGINAFALGVMEKNKDAIIEVSWVNSWYDNEKERELTLDLIADGIDIISQHSDSSMPQLTAHEKNVLSIPYNNPAIKYQLEDTYLTGVVINWANFYLDDVSHIINGTWKSRIFNEGISKNIVKLDTINTSVIRINFAEEVGKVSSDMKYEDFEVFTGPIYDNEGNLRLSPGKVMDKEQLFMMDFFNSNVIDNL